MLRDERKAQHGAQARERELSEAAAARELKEREPAAARELEERELAAAKAAAQAAHEREMQKMRLQQDIEQKKHIFEMERLAAEQNVKPAVQHKEDKSSVTAKTPKIPALDEGKDEMDSICLGLKGMLQLRNGRKRIGLLVRAHFSKARHLMHMH